MVVASHAPSPEALTIALSREANTILIVEHEVPVRFEVADYLRECGYHVIEARMPATN
jgi:hypothetical protein